MARHRVKVLEGDEVRESLVPFATVYSFPDHFDGMSYNDAIAGGLDWAKFASHVAWHTLSQRGEEDREFGEFLAAVEWIELEQIPDMDPSGGEPTRRSSSPASSRTRTSASSSSTGRNGSKKPSGGKS